MFAHSGVFAVPPPIHPSMYGLDSRPAHTRSSSLRHVSSSISPAKASPAHSVRPKPDSRRLRQRTLPFGGDDIVAIKTMRIANDAPMDHQAALSGDFLVERIKTSTQMCKAEELRVQQLAGSIKHKLSEYPTVVERMTALDQQAIDLYESLMASTDTDSATVSAYDSRLSPAGRSDTDDRGAPYGGLDGQRVSSRISAAQRLEQLSTHIRAAKKAMEENEALMRVNKDKLQSAEAILGRDQDIIDEVERRIQLKRAEIRAIRARQQLQNIALTLAAIIGSIAICIIAVYLSIKRDASDV